MVVQPGVAFGDVEVFDYDRAKARALSRYIERDAPGVRRKWLCEEDGVHIGKMQHAGTGQFRCEVSRVNDVAFLR